MYFSSLFPRKALPVILKISCTLQNYKKEHSLSGYSEDQNPLLMYEHSLKEKEKALLSKTKATLGRKSF